MRHAPQTIRIAPGMQRGSFQESVIAFSLDAVAKAADVSRLTVYNQLGSRRALVHRRGSHDEVGSIGSTTP